MEKIYYNINSDARLSALAQIQYTFHCTPKRSIMLYVPSVYTAGDFPTGTDQSNNMITT